jgi:hypothetical protein
MSAHERAEVPEIRPRTLHTMTALHRADQLEVRIKERLTAGQYDLVMAYVSAREDADEESWSASIDHLVRGLIHHFPQWDRVIRLVAEHANETGLGKVGTCCLGGTS